MINLVQWDYNDNTKDILIGAYIADIHFGARDPEEQYKILKEQFIAKLVNLPLDLVAIAGDLFDHKAMANSDMIMYALLFIEDLINEVIRPKQITLVVVAGTYSHDAKQLKLLYKYLHDMTVDIRIVETIKFEYIKGHKILCIPELAGVDEDIYKKFLFQSGWYDGVIMHGTIHKAVAKDNVGNTRLFYIEDFRYCTGPIISGHVHEPGCFNGYFYYTGSPYSWSFADHDNKGFLIVANDRKSRMHFAYKERIESFRYETINLDDLVCNDAQVIINYINNLKEERGIDYIRVEFKVEVQNEIKALLDTYYRNNSRVKLKYDYVKEEEVCKTLAEINESLNEYAYLYDPALTEYDKLARFINGDMGYVYVTAEEIKKIVEEEF